mgnify:CR=1 FL=1
MFEPVFVTPGLVNNQFLVLLFLMRKKHLRLVQKVGWAYLLLAIPAIYAMFLVQQEQKSLRYTVFLGIFLAFLAIEALYDWILKLPSRATMNWKLLVPYVDLYLSMTYGFVVMVWKYDSAIGGMITLVLFIIQLTANFLSHPRSDDAKK